MKKPQKTPGKKYIHLSELLETNMYLSKSLFQPFEVPRGSGGSKVLHEIAITLILILFVKGAHLISLKTLDMCKIIHLVFLTWHIFCDGVEDTFALKNATIELYFRWSALANWRQCLCFCLAVLCFPPQATHIIVTGKTLA